MKEQVNLTQLRVTEGYLLDAPNVHQFYVLARGNLPIDEPRVVKSEEGMFLVSGHNQAYAILRAGHATYELEILATDSDVASCNNGLAQGRNTVDELLEACRQAHISSIKQGIEFLDGYVHSFRAPYNWSDPVVHIFAPSPSLDLYENSEGLQKVAAGKGLNIARSMTSLGYGMICAYSFVGGNSGQELREIVNSARIPFYFVDNEDPTVAMKLKGSHSSQRVIPENPRVRTEALEDLEQKLKSAVKPGDVVVLAGSLPRNAPKNTYERLVRDFKGAGTTTVLDTSDTEAFRLAMQAGPAIVSPNNGELEQFLGASRLNDEQARKALTDVRETYDTRVILAKRDSRGVFVSSNEGNYTAPALEVPVECTIGAGDSFLAGYLVAQLRRERIEDRIRNAMAAAASHIQKLGNAPADIREVEELKGMVTVRAA